MIEGKATFPFCKEEEGNVSQRNGDIFLFCYSMPVAVSCLAVTELMCEKSTEKKRKEVSYGNS